MIVIVTGTKGRGSNMAAILKAFPDQKFRIIGPNPASPSFELARSMNQVPFAFSSDAELKDLTQDASLVCLAGFMKLIPESVLAGPPILNIHCSLLPKYGGKGMYGMRVHEAVIAAGETESGCTVHRVTPVYDEGEIIVQRRVPVLADDTPETLAARVLVAEHIAYPEAIRIALALP